MLSPSLALLLAACLQAPSVVEVARPARECEAPAACMLSPRRERCQVDLVPGPLPCAQHVPGIDAAQGVGPGLPWLASRVAAGRTKGVRGNDAPPLLSGPAGVPGGFGSRGAALLDAGPASGESLQGPLAIAAGRHLGCGASVQERG